MSANEIFIPCAEEIGKRRDYRSLQQLLQLVRDNGYTDVKLHDDIIEACVRESGSDVEQVSRSNLFTKNLFSFSTESRTRCIDSINQK